MATEMDERPEPTVLAQAVVRFAGDSGDGMQLAGAQFTASSALFGNDLATLPNFPAEIRAPAGTVAGISAFQVHIADWDILTPGDSPDVLVAMNPAALRANIDDLAKNGTLIVNSDAFEERNLTKAGYSDNPLTDGSLDMHQVLAAPMEELTKEAVSIGVVREGISRAGRRHAAEDVGPIGTAVGRDVNVKDRFAVVVELGDAS